MLVLCPSDFIGGFCGVLVDSGNTTEKVTATQSTMLNRYVVGSWLSNLLINAYYYVKVDYLTRVPIYSKTVPKPKMLTLCHLLKKFPMKMFYNK